jgi:hypothetical protein
MPTACTSQINQGTPKAELQNARTSTNSLQRWVMHWSQQAVNLAGDKTRPEENAHWNTGIVEPGLSYNSGVPMRISLMKV